ncbi:DUF3604 domain-containing protein, partial [Chlamydiales bacterium]|nr:DUF3604 domain-containing protein [Chlamydiales bacterium]
MRRSICYSEPAIAKAGTVGTWRFVHTTATNLPKNTIIRFDLDSNGRDIDWEVPTTNLKKNTNVIYLQFEDGEVIPAKEIKVPN